MSFGVGHPRTVGQFLFASSPGSSSPTPFGPWSSGTAAWPRASSSPTSGPGSFCGGIIICDRFVFLSGCCKSTDQGQRVGIVIVGGHFWYTERGGRNISTHFRSSARIYISTRMLVFQGAGLSDASSETEHELQGGWGWEGARGAGRP